MADLEWRLVVEAEVPAKPTGVWTLVHTYLDRCLRLKLEARGQWTYSANLKDLCGPDGDLASGLDASRCLIPKAPVGALIGKLGGSTGGLDDGYLFVVGSYCILEPGRAAVPKTGPLYLAINDRPDGLADNNGALKVRVY